MRLLIDRVSKTYGATRALIDVSTEFVGGEVHCLLGENGAGKSTLGKVIGGLVDADSGHMELDGQQLHLTDARGARAAGIAIVHQELALAPDLSVRANLSLGSERSMFSRIQARQERECAAEVLGDLGLQVDPERRTGELLPAEQQLLEIGKALIAKPRLVVFDEPTSTLGAVEKRRLFNAIRRLRNDGVAVVLVTHHIEDVMEVADQVSVMRNGSLVDSFPLGSLNADEVLERLTGRKRSAVEHAPLSSTADAVLTIEGIPTAHGSTAAIHVRVGEIVGFYGVVGCGAEKIVRGVAGEADAGRLTFRLRDRVHAPSRAAKALAAGVAYLPAGRARNAILGSRSILENLTVGRLDSLARFGVVRSRAERAVVSQALATVRARFGVIDDPITSLSGGNQQKVMLARVLAGRRDVLVLEEPTAGVDIDAKEQIHRLIREAAASGSAVLLLSSDLGEAIGLCHVLHAMYAGRLVASHRSPTEADEAAILFDVLGKRRESPSLQPEAS